MAIETRDDAYYLMNRIEQHLMQRHRKDAEDELRAAIAKGFREGQKDGFNIGLREGVEKAAAESDAFVKEYEGSTSEWMAIAISKGIRALLPASEGVKNG